MRTAARRIFGAVVARELCTRARAELNTFCRAAPPQPPSPVMLMLLLSGGVVVVVAGLAHKTIDTLQTLSKTHSARLDFGRQIRAPQVFAATLSTKPANTPARPFLTETLNCRYTRENTEPQTNTNTANTPGT